MQSKIYDYTPAGKQVIQQMIRELGTRTSINAITDHHVDFNNDGKVSGLELTILKQSINRQGKVDEQKLQEKLYRLNNGNAIFTVSTDIDKTKSKKVSYVSFSNYKYIEVEEKEQRTPQKRFGIHPDRIEIEDYTTGETIKIPRTKETEEKYLKGIDLDI